MKKINRIYLFIAVILAGVSAILILNNKMSSLGNNEKDFAVEDTAIVNKVFLADKSGNQVLLKRISPGRWSVNGKFNARTDAISTLLYTISSLRVKNPVAKAARNNVVKDLASGGVKVEVYSNDKLKKTYYVGGPTQDDLGTFMILEDSSEPMIMNIPGFDGFLTTRYFTSEEQWRDPAIFRYKPSEIASIAVDYPAEPAKSFIISLTGKTNYTIKNPSNNEELQNPDSIKVFSFLSHFQSANWEGFAKLKPNQLDSVLKTTPLAILKIGETGGGKKELKVYLKTSDKDNAMQQTVDGKPGKFDLDRMYMQIPGEKKLVFIQSYVFDKILASYDDFKKGNK